MNLAILAATALGIWLVLIKLFGQLGCESSRSALAAWLVALLWSVHPVNIMAITYVSQRYACMAGAFSVWSIYFFHLGNEVRKRKWPYWVLSGFFCAIALLSKETALTLPLILLCYKLYFFRRAGPGLAEAKLEMDSGAAHFLRGGRGPGLAAGDDGPARDRCCENALQRLAEVAQRAASFPLVSLSHSLSFPKLHRPIPRFPGFIIPLSSSHHRDLNGSALMRGLPGYFQSEGMEDFFFRGDLVSWAAYCGGPAPAHRPGQ